MSQNDIDDFFNGIIKSKQKQLLYDSIFNGDSYDVLSKMPSNIVDCVVTSPPYNLGGDFHICNNGKRTTYGAYNSFCDKLDENDYQENQIKVLNELHRVTTENAFCFYVHKERIVKNNIISPIEWIKKSKWLISQVVVLDMSATANVDKRRFFPTHEYIYVLCKSEKSKMHNENKLTSVWKVKKTPRRISKHPATFDYYIPEQCILASTNENDLVLDCYCGTGTTLLASKNNNRHFVGIEIDYEYCKLSKERVTQKE